MSSAPSWHNVQKPPQRFPEHCKAGNTCLANVLSAFACPIELPSRLLGRLSRQLNLLTNTGLCIGKIVATDFGSPHFLKLAKSCSVHIPNVPKTVPGRVRVKFAQNGGHEKATTRPLSERRRVSHWHLLSVAFPSQRGRSCVGATYRPQRLAHTKGQGEVAGEQLLREASSHHWRSGPQWHGRRFARDGARVARGYRHP